MCAEDSTAAGATRGGRTALRVWLAAVSVYVLGAFHRSSLGVASLAAADRFQIAAVQLATLMVAQLLAYASMQIPVGMLVDRFGARRLLVLGALVMTGAQMGFAVTDEYPGALVARVLVGTGDAMVLISVLRIVTAWFTPVRSMLMFTLTTAIGGLGALIAAVPLSRSLLAFGWTATFLVSASFGIALSLLTLALVRNAPPGPPTSRAPDDLPTIVRDVGAVCRNPGTRLGFWSHFALLCPFNVFVLMWGYPYLTQSETLGSETAAMLLSLPIVVLVLAGPLIGAYVSRHVWQRSTIVLATLAVVALTWTVTLLWPGDAPPALLGVLAVVIGVCAPASVIGFDVVRTFAPESQLSRATGIVNFGGFGASVLTILGVGAVLDVLTPAGSTSYDAATYRWAMCVQYVAWLLGGLQVWRYRRRARAHLFATQPSLARSISGLERYSPSPVRRGKTR